MTTRWHEVKKPKLCTSGWHSTTRMPMTTCMLAWHSTTRTSMTSSMLAWHFTMRTPATTSTECIAHFLGIVVVSSSSHTHMHIGSSVPGYVIKKDRKRGVQHGASERQRMYDVNMAIWSTLLNTTQQAAVHLGQDYEVNLRFVKNHLWNSVGQLFNETGRLIRDQTEITGVNTINFK